MINFRASARAADNDIQVRVPDPDQQPGRRKFMTRASGLGAAVVGAIALTWTDAPAALAFDEGCCNLATRTPCGGSWGKDGTFTCPSGSSKHFWSCYTSGDHFLFHCWECNTGSNCDGGTFKCSNYWDIYIG